MLQQPTKLIRALVRKLGLDLVRYPPREGPNLLADFEPSLISTLREVQPYTMTSPERVQALVQAVTYLIDAELPGAIVECGVSDRPLYLFDTFEGMPEPGAQDIDYTGLEAATRLGREAKSDPRSGWCVASLADVSANLRSTGYPVDNIHYVQGRVEQTIPAAAPAQIALLRLDTDWYESTYHELVHLYPRLVPGGVIIIDDYGHWQGARRAVDEYLREHNIKLLLNRVDYTARIGVKLSSAP
jgi:O-methyltransferase